MKRPVLTEVENTCNDGGENYRISNYGWILVGTFL